MRSFIGWKQVPEFDSSSLDDNPFAGTRSQNTSKVPVEEWLCRKMEMLNVTVQEGYPSQSSETAGLDKDQFVKTPKTLKWYMFSEDFSRSKIHPWTNEPVRLNSSFPRIASLSLSRTLRKWERASHDQSYMCNLAAAFSRCLTKIHDSMTTHLKMTQNYTLRLDTVYPQTGHG